MSPNTTTQENADDALGGIRFLRERGFTKIGIIGHSEGGLIADKVAANSDLINFIIEIGGPVVSGDEILVFQNEILLKDGGLPDEYIKMYSDAMRGMLESQKENENVIFDETKYEIFSTENSLNPVIAPLAKNLKDNFSSLTPWLKYFINYNPAIDIDKITVPILMLYGEKDLQVPPSINVPILEKKFPRIDIKVYPELNHLMQHCLTGKITEYAEIEETFAPDVLKDMKEFIFSLE
ncbi:MAG: hypothetical protein J1F12_05725 [Muribaculaceae bacterium]|nr:hypothetical protein [Muribaculaceae bacterium]